MEGPVPWRLLTHHGQVLLCIHRDPDARLRDIAELVGITERAARSITAELVAAGCLTKVRNGRRNHYELHPDLRPPHPLESQQPVGALLEAFTRP